MQNQEGINYFSDVHSNPWAWKVIVAVIRRLQQNCRWYFGGDAVGWQYSPIDVVIALMQLEQEGLLHGKVLGNHDAFGLDMFKDLPEQIARRIASAFSAGALSRESICSYWLRNMPLSIDLGQSHDCVIVHHSPFRLPADSEDPTMDHFKYLSQDFPEQWPEWSNCNWSVILSGHDHTPAIHRVARGLENPRIEDVETFIPDEGNLKMKVFDNFRYWVQSGAAGGPPRDGVMKVNWVEYIPGESIELHREDFEPGDVDELMQFIETQPFGSDLNWDRFSKKSEKPVAHGTIKS